MNTAQTVTDAEVKRFQKIQQLAGLEDALDDLLQSRTAPAGTVPLSQGNRDQGHLAVADSGGVQRGWFQVSERMPEDRIRVIAAQGKYTVGDCFYGRAGLMIGRCDDPQYVAERAIECWRYSYTEDAVQAHLQPTQWLALPFPSDVAQPTTPAPGPVAQGESIRWHELKTDPDSFDAVMRGEKTCEIRRNDRNFKVGDGLLLRRTKYTGGQMHMRPEQCPLEYTGEECRRVISHVLTGYGLEDNCALSFATPQVEAVKDSVQSVDGRDAERGSFHSDSSDRDRVQAPGPTGATYLGAGSAVICDGLTQDEVKYCMDALAPDHDGSDFEPECPGCTAYKKLAAILSSKAAPGGDGV